MNYFNKTTILRGLAVLLVIILLSVLIAQVIVPALRKDMLENQILLEQETQLREAGIKYYSDNSDELPNYTNELKYIRVSKLIELGYIDNILDKDGDLCDYNFSTVSVRKIGENEYNYYPDLLCGDYATYRTWSDWTDWNETAVENKTNITDVEKIYYYNYETGKTKKTDWTVWKDMPEESITFSSDKEVEYQTLYSYQEKQWKWYNTLGNDYADGYYVTAPNGYPYKDETKSIIEYKYATNISETCLDGYYDNGTELKGYSIDKDNTQTLYKYSKQEINGTEFFNCGGWAQSLAIAKSSCPNDCDKVLEIKNPDGLYQGVTGYQCQAEKQDYISIKYDNGNWTSKTPSQMAGWNVEDTKTQYKYCKTLEYVTDHDEIKYADGYYEEGKGPTGYKIDKTKSIVEYVWIKPTSSLSTTCKANAYYTSQSDASKDNCFINKNETKNYRCFSYKVCNGLSDAQCKVSGTTKTTCYTEDTIGTQKQTIDAYDVLPTKIGQCYSIPSVYYHKTEEYGYIRDMYFNGLVYRAVKRDSRGYATSDLCNNYGKYFTTESNANSFVNSTNPYGCTLNWSGATSYPMRCFSYSACSSLDCSACKNSTKKETLCFSDGVSGPGTIYTTPYNTLYSASANNTCVLVPKTSYDSGTSKACSFKTYYNGIAYKAYENDGLGQGERYPESGWTKDIKDDSWIEQDSRILYKYYKTVKVASAGDSLEWTTTKLDSKYTVLETRKKYAYYALGDEKIYSEDYYSKAPVGYPYKDETNYAMSTQSEWSTKKIKEQEDRVIFSKQQYKTRDIYMEWTKVNTKPLTQTEFEKEVMKELSEIDEDPFLQYTTLENYKYRTRNISKFASKYTEDYDTWWLDSFFKLIITISLVLLSLSKINTNKLWIANIIMIILSLTQIIFKLTLWNYSFSVEIIVILLNLTVMLIDKFFPQLNKY